MELVSLESFDADAFDAAVLRTPDVDPFCSASDWILSAREAWSAGVEPWVRRGEYGYAAFLRLEQAAGFSVLHSFDTMWGFACPLVGAPGLAAEFAQDCSAQRSAWRFLVVTGLRPDSPLHWAVLEEFGASHTAYECARMRRWQASLAGGIDGFLERRTPKFRQTLRSAARKCKAIGVEFAFVEEFDFDRILAIERCSWKGNEATGLLLEEMASFYRPLAERVGRRGGLRVMYARHRDRDIGYILGGVFGGTYRGFQFSYDRTYAEYSIGNVMQYEQIRQLGRQGVATYDLGIDMDYKRRWADEPNDTVSIAVLR